MNEYMQMVYAVRRLFGKHIHSIPLKYQSVARLKFNSRRRITTRSTWQAENEKGE